ncbi:MAG: phenylacetate--CoA ligase family protein [Planctomycetes bacterium]|nr:phenylacetate--CoA ligase family protein [Planctomycetota bacterium]
MIKNRSLKVLTKLAGLGYHDQYIEIKSLPTPEKYLEELILHSYQNVPYYHDIFKEIGIINNDKKVDLSKFNRIPILTKDIIREHWDEIVSKDYTTRKWYYNSSGGSTGEPMKFIQDKTYHKWGMATNYFWHKDILGIDEPSVKTVYLWGSERDIFKHGREWKSRIYSWLTNTVVLNSFKMTKEDMNHYINTINSYRPDLVSGYAGSLYDLCRYAERKGAKLYSPYVVVGAAEALSGEMRETIERVFGTKVYNFYGSREVSNLAGECKEGSLHILSFHNYFEVLDKYDKPVREGEEGKVVVTNLHNYSMPLIRYEIGDMATLGPKECDCGNPLPTLLEVSGRITDHFVRKDGTLIRLPTTLFFFKDWIKAFQIIQEDYSRIRLLIVLDGITNALEKEEIEKKIKRLMGNDSEIIWEFVEKIPKTETGKYLYRKSLVPRE